MGKLAVNAIIAGATVMALGLGDRLRAEERPATLSVTGQGSVTRAPDMAEISVGVETAAERAAPAIAANGAAARKIIAAAKDAGVAEADIQTRNFSVRPRYEQRRASEPGAAPKIAGYVVVNELSLTLRDMDGIGGALDRLLKAGANRINAIRFGLDDEAGALDEARRLAVADAKAKARVYAQAAGIELDDILSITEGGVAGPPPPMAAEMRLAASAVPIESGATLVRASVTIVWEIEDD